MVHVSAIPTATAMSLVATIAQTSTTAATSSGDSSGLFLWMIGLLTLAFAFGALEIFIPSGGVLGIVAILSALGGLGAAFMISPVTGLGALGFLTIATPTSLWIALRVFPSTPMGKRIILTDGATEEDIQEKAYLRSQELEAIGALVGSFGEAVTALRPGGTIRIGDDDIEAFAETGMIQAGTKVEVTRIVSRQVKVHPVDHNASATDSGAS